MSGPDALQVLLDAWLAADDADRAYLLESSAIPRLLLALEALTAGRFDEQRPSMVRDDFNPLRWLAQFLMRNDLVQQAPASSSAVADADTKASADILALFRDEGAKMAARVRTKQEAERKKALAMAAEAEAKRAAEERDRLAAAASKRVKQQQQLRELLPLIGDSEVDIVPISVGGSVRLLRDQKQPEAVKSSTAVAFGGQSSDNHDAEAGSLVSTTSTNIPTQIDGDYLHAAERVYDTLAEYSNTSATVLAADLVDGIVKQATKDINADDSTATAVKDNVTKFLQLIKFSQVGPGEPITKSNWLDSVQTASASSSVTQQDLNVAVQHLMQCAKTSFGKNSPGTPHPAEIDINTSFPPRASINNQLEVAARDPRLTVEEYAMFATASVSAQLSADGTGEGGIYLSDVVRNNETVTFKCVAGPVTKRTSWSGKTVQGQQALDYEEVVRTMRPKVLQLDDRPATATSGSDNDLIRCDVLVPVCVNGQCVYVLGVDSSSLGGKSAGQEKQGITTADLQFLEDTAKQIGHDIEAIEYRAGAIQLALSSTRWMNTLGHDATFYVLSKDMASNEQIWSGDDVVQMQRANDLLPSQNQQESEVDESDDDESDTDSITFGSVLSMSRLPEESLEAIMEQDDNLDEARETSDASLGPITENEEVIEQEVLEFSQQAMDTAENANASYEAVNLASKAGLVKDVNAKDNGLSSTSNFEATNAVSSTSTSDASARKIKVNVDKPERSRPVSAMAQLSASQGSQQNIDKSASFPAKTTRNHVSFEEIADDLSGDEAYESKEGISPSESNVVQHVSASKSRQNITSSASLPTISSHVSFEAIPSGKETNEVTGHSAESAAGSVTTDATSGATATSSSIRHAEKLRPGTAMASATRQDDFFVNAVGGSQNSVISSELQSLNSVTATMIPPPAPSEPSNTYITAIGLRGDIDTPSGTVNIAKQVIQASVTTKAAAASTLPPASRARSPIAGGSTRALVSIDEKSEEMKDNDENHNVGVRKSPFRKLQVASRRDSDVVSAAVKAYKNNDPTGTAQNKANVSMPIRGKDGKVVAIVMMRENSMTPAETVDTNTNERQRVSAQLEKDAALVSMVIEKGTKSLAKPKRKKRILDKQKSVDEVDDTEAASDDELIFPSLMFDAVRERISQIDSRAIAELRSYKKPPRVIYIVLKSVLYLLQYEPSELKKWADVSKKINGNFVKQLVKYDPLQKQKKKIFRRIEKLLSKLPSAREIRNQSSEPTDQMYQWLQLSMELRRRGVQVRTSQSLAGTISDLLEAVDSTQSIASVHTQDVTNIKSLKMPTPTALLGEKEGPQRVKPGIQ